MFSWFWNITFWKLSNPYLIILDMKKMEDNYKLGSFLKFLKNQNIRVNI